MKKLIAVLTVISMLVPAVSALADVFIRIDRDDPDAWRAPLANVRFLDEERMSGSAQFSTEQFRELAAQLKEKAERIWRGIRDSLPDQGLRSVLRSQAGLERGSSLYFYAEQANVQQAEKKLMTIMREKEPQLKAREVFHSRGYRSEHDAIHLMHMLSSQYEPAAIWHREKSSHTDL